jgi:antitoxin CcdA
MAAVFDPSAPRKAVNLSINSDLLRRARALDINLSATLEEALDAVVKARLQAQWLEENRAALAGYNAWVEDAGVFSDGVRSF